MPEVRVRVDGADELRRALRSVDRSLGKELAAVNKSAAQLVVGAALPAVPVRTGKLKRSVRALGSQRSGQAKAGTASVVYAAAIHWGRTSGNVGSPPGNRRGNNLIRARPFLWDAAQEWLPRIELKYRDEITALLDRAVRGQGVS